LNKKELSSARERVTGIKEQLGRVPPVREIKDALIKGFRDALGMEFEHGGLTAREEELFRQRLAYMKSDAWIKGVRLPLVHQEILRSIHKEDGGLIRVALKVDVERSIIRDLLITGDFFINPNRAVYDLEAALKNRRIDEAEATLREFFVDNNVELMNLTPDDFWEAMRLALEKLEYSRFGLSMEEADFITCLNGRLEHIIRTCDLILLPYCAKLPKCKFRFRDGCDQCGQCTVGQAYAMAEKAGLRVKTIQNYEHLVEELILEKDMGTRAYIGCCCDAFMLKRQEAFKDAGLPALLIDIENTTCYELNLEREAYIGNFKNQTHLRLPLLEKVLSILGDVRQLRTVNHEAA